MVFRKEQANYNGIHYKQHLYPTPSKHVYLKHFIELLLCGKCAIQIKLGSRASLIRRKLMVCMLYASNFVIGDTNMLLIFPRKHGGGSQLLRHILKFSYE